MQTSSPETSTTTSLQVAGMTCDHCAMAVGRELDALPGVQTVQVSLPTGEVTVTHDQPLDPQQVAHAIDEVKGRGVPEWLQVDAANTLGRVLSIPTREQINLPVQEQLIVELYSK